jgi:hypothetical protein
MTTKTAHLPVLAVVLSQWEMIEVELSHMYAWLMNRPEEIGVLRQYGEKRIFAERIKELRQIADVYFRGNPHQETEGEPKYAHRHNLQVCRAPQ